MHPPLDEEGYLADYRQWSETTARWLAGLEHVELAESHWQLITWVREYFQTFEHAPAMRPLVNWLKLKGGPEIGNSRYLHRHFPVSPAKQLARIAGLPKPTKCL